MAGFQTSELNQLNGGGIVDSASGEWKSENDERFSIWLGPAATENSSGIVYVRMPVTHFTRRVSGHRLQSCRTRVHSGHKIADNILFLTAVGLRVAPAFGAERMKETFFRKL